MQIMNSRPTNALLVASLMGLFAVAACSTAPDTRAGRSDLRHTSAEALAQAQQNDPSLRNVIRNSAGYAVFPSVGKGAVAASAVPTARATCTRAVPWSATAT